MNRRVLVFNLLLLALCLYVGRQVKRDFQRFRAEHSSGSIPATPDREEKQKVFSSGYVPVPLSATAYEQVSSKNLFLESRSLQAQAENQAVETVPLLNPKPILIGVAKVGDQLRAMVRRQQATPGKRVIDTLRIGDQYEGYKVTLIAEDRVEFAYTSSSGQVTPQTISFFDPTNRQAGQAPVRTTPVSTSQIIQVGPGGAAISSAVAVSQPVPSAAANQTPAGSTGRTPAMRPGPAPGQTSSTGETLANTGQTSSTGGTRTGRSLQRNEFIDAQGRRVIRTPFGDVVRPADPQ